MFWFFSQIIKTLNHHNKYMALASVRQAKIQAAHIFLAMTSCALYSISAWAHYILVSKQNTSIWNLLVSSWLIRAWNAL